MYCEIKPPAIGPTRGPRKLAAVKRAKGTDRSSGAHMSVIDPPELETGYY